MDLTNTHTNTPILKKTCSQCGLCKNLDQFHKHTSSKDGLTYKCKNCRNKENRDYKKINKKRIKIHSAEYYKRTIIKRKEYSKRWAENNKDKVSARIRRWYDNNKSRKNAQTRLRQSNKLQRTPAWADLDKIAVLYEKAKWLESLTGLRYHVDHIIPLQGEKVSGLHVWENLQILEESINCSKSNKLENII